jgi:hypothetical protein
MIAEKAADLIRQRRLLPPAETTEAPAAQLEAGGSTWR